MLRKAFCRVVREARDAPGAIAIVANPDGSVWIEKAGVGIVVSDHTIEASDRERVIRRLRGGESGTPLLPARHCRTPRPRRAV